MEIGEEERLGDGCEKELGGVCDRKWIPQAMEAGQDEGLLQAFYYRTDSGYGELIVEDRKASENSPAESSPV